MMQSASLVGLGLTVSPLPELSRTTGRCRRVESAQESPSGYHPSEGFGRLPPFGRATLYRAGQKARATEPRDVGLGPSGCDRFCNPIPRVKLQLLFLLFVQLLCSI